jgi:hypothetical protein
MKEHKIVCGDKIFIKYLKSDLLSCIVVPNHDLGRNKSEEISACKL